jgi:hypothetical protein
LRTQERFNVGNLNAGQDIEDRYVIEVGVAQFLGLCQCRLDRETFLELHWSG